MNQQTFYAILFLGIFLLLLAFSHTLYRYYNWPSERSRKFLHVTGGLLALCCPLIFDSHWWVLILCLLAFLLLLFTYMRQLLPSVHLTYRKSIGSVIFPVPVYICFLAASQSHDDLLFYLPVSFLTISDTVAELAGKKWGRQPVFFLHNQKTLVGSAGFVICSLLLAVAWSTFFHYPLLQVFWISVITSVTAAVTELFSNRGLDNFTVPMVVLACLYLLRNLNS
jgi:phytol kinase